MTTDTGQIQSLIGISPRRLAELEDTERAFNALCELRRDHIVVPDSQASTERIREVCIAWADRQKTSS